MKIKNLEIDHIKQILLQMFKTIKQEARKNKICKRKACGCAISKFKIVDGHMTYYTAYIAVNGPSGSENKCSGIKGACGCSHAEPRAIMKFLKENTFLTTKDSKIILLTTYSSCINCANIIIDSGVIDAVGYEFLAPHWAKEPNNAKAMLDRSLVHFSKKEINGETLRKIFDNIR